MTHKGTVGERAKSIVEKLWASKGIGLNTDERELLEEMVSYYLFRKKFPSLAMRNKKDVQKYHRLIDKKIIIEHGFPKGTYSVGFTSHEEQELQNAVENEKMAKGGEILSSLNPQQKSDVEDYLPSKIGRINNGNVWAQEFYKNDLLRDNATIDDYYYPLAKLIASREGAGKFLDNDDFWGDFIYRLEELGQQSKIFFSKGGKIGDKVKFVKGYGYWDVSKYPYGGDFKRFKEGEEGIMIEGTIKVGGQMRVKLDDGREIVTDYQAIDFPTNDDKYTLYEKNKYLWTFGYEKGGKVKTKSGVYVPNENDRIFIEEAMRIAMGVKPYIHINKDEQSYSIYRDEKSYKKKYGSEFELYYPTKENPQWVFIYFEHHIGSYEEPPSDEPVEMTPQKTLNKALWEFLLFDLDVSFRNVSENRYMREHDLGKGGKVNSNINWIITGATI